MLLCSDTPADIVEAEKHAAHMNKLVAAEAKGLRTEQTVDAQADPEPAAEPLPAHSKARL